MSAIRTAFEAGDLPGALAAATAAVKSAPRDFGARWVLAEMLVFSGELERADRALDAIIAEEPSPAVLEFRRLLRAAEHRRRVFGKEGEAPKLQGEEATPAQTACLRALVELRTGNAEAAAAAAAEAEELRPRIPGTHTPAGAGATPVTFDDLRDADDMFSPFLEALTIAGDYMWIPFERIRSLEFEVPKRPRDLCWRRAAIEMKDGQEGVIYVPVIYPWGDSGMPDGLRLGRTTDWLDSGGGPVRGLGQRVMLAGEDALPLNEAGTLHFE